MREKFEKQLLELGKELTAMGALCEVAIASAAKALAEGDKKLAEKAVEADAEIDDKEEEIEKLCMKLLLQQQPVAKDLRQISSALKMITDMERIGDQAADIAGIVKFADIRAGGSGLHVGEMARATIKMVTESVDAYVRSDLELARAVIAYDDTVDGLFARVKGEVVEMIGRDKNCGEYAVDVLMIAKYFERIGDHAVNIAEWVEYSITGVKEI